MARRHGGDDDLYSKMKQDRGEELEKEKQKEKDLEKETDAEKEIEPEHARLQNTLGNQAMASMLPKSGGGAKEGGGVEAELAFREEEDEERDRDYGGDDDAADPGPITVEELVRGWNAGTKPSKDKAVFAEYMPDDELPPEDSAWLVAVRAAGTIALPEAVTIDGLLQPSLAVAIGALTHWANAVDSWTQRTPVHRLLASAATRSPPFLQDPHARVLVNRLRTAALAMDLLVDAPALRDSADPGVALFVAATLELAGRARRMEQIRTHTREATKDAIPVALTVFEQFVAGGDGSVELATPSPHAVDRMRAVFAHLLEFVDCEALVPILEVGAVESDPQDDDPLGLDDLLSELTGGAPDLQAVPYKTAIETCERLAAHAARTRVEFAAAAVLLSELMTDWPRGAPNATLRNALASIDVEAGQALQLLVEVARAAQRREQPPPKLQIGLKHCARAVARIQSLGTDLMIRVVCGAMPGRPDPGPAVEHPTDPLSMALRDGRPAEALDWLGEELGDELAVALCRGAAGALPAELLEPLGRAAARGGRDDAVASAAALAAGACALATGKADTALRLSATLRERALRRRNGIALAHAALLAMEACLLVGDEAGAREVRLRAGRMAWSMGASAALSLLARWAPPAAEGDADDGAPG